MAKKEDEKQLEAKGITMEIPPFERFFLDYLKRIYNQDTIAETILLLIRKEKGNINKFLLNDQNKDEFERRLPKEMVQEWEDKIQKKLEVKK